MQKMMIHYNDVPIYPIVLSENFDALGEALDDLMIKDRKVCIVTDSHVADFYLEQVEHIVKEHCAAASHFIFPAGEESKTLTTVENLYEFLIQNKFERKDMLVALGGMFSERSGVINIALEGIMAIGGLAGVFVLALCGDSLPSGVLVAVSILASAVAGILYSLLLGFSAITLKADQTIGGTALNMLATAVAIVAVKAFNNSSAAGNGAASAKLSYSNKAFIYKIGPLTINIFLIIGIIILIVSYVFLFKTKWGLRLRACGEHPQAADSVGINVYQWRYTGVMISGALGGIGGFAYIVPSVTTWNFEVGVAGAGFLALAVMIFGQWKPFNIAGAAVFFAVFRSLANIADSTVLANLGLSKNIYSMMPFIASMIILAFTSKNSQAPKAEGIPYDKGAR